MIDGVRRSLRDCLQAFQLASGPAWLDFRRQSAGVPGGMCRTRHHDARPGAAGGRARRSPACRAAAGAWRSPGCRRHSWSGSDGRNRAEQALQGVGRPRAGRTASAHHGDPRHHRLLAGAADLRRSADRRHGGAPRPPAVFCNRGPTGGARCHAQGTGDIELARAVQNEERRQVDHVELIASENYTSPLVMAIQNSVFTNKYAEGYPGKRY